MSVLGARRDVVEIHRGFHTIGNGGEMADEAVLGAFDEEGGDDDKSDTDEAKMPETNPHTHPEHAQVSHILKNGSSQPRTTPRDNDRKRLRQKYAARGQHTFDGYRLIVGDAA